MTMTDKMKYGDNGDVEVALRCAKCGKAVQPNESHNCAKEEKKDEDKNSAEE